ncbi:MAG: hypothetical protein VX768_11470 [Planctomycetota bacterium]|nr:hypothetical protein [Planctomycetota bacterium]
MNFPTVFPLYIFTLLTVLTGPGCEPSGSSKSEVVSNGIPLRNVEQMRSFLSPREGIATWCYSEKISDRKSGQVLLRFLRNGTFMAWLEKGGVHTANNSSLFQQATGIPAGKGTRFVRGKWKATLKEIQFSEISSDLESLPDKKASLKWRDGKLGIVINNQTFMKTAQDAHEPPAGLWNPPATK